MNSGAATSGNEFIACAIFCGTIDGDRPPKSDERERREPHRREQRQPEQDGHQPDADDLEHQVGHSTAPLVAAARTARGRRSACDDLARALQRGDDAGQHHRHVHPRHRDRQRRRLEVVVLGDEPDAVPR